MIRQLFFLLATAVGVKAESVKAADLSQYYVVGDYALICEEPEKSEKCEKKSLYGYSFYSEELEQGFRKIESAMPGGNYSGKWISDSGLVEASEFRPVNDWKIEYLIINLELFMDLYVFDRSGRYVIRRYFDDGSTKIYSTDSQLYRYGDLVVKTELPDKNGASVFGESIGVIAGDSGHSICPLAHYRKKLTCKNFRPPVNKYSTWYAINYLQFSFGDHVQPLHFNDFEIDLAE